jgi:hypothetical protein
VCAPGAALAEYLGLHTVTSSSVRLPTSPGPPSPSSYARARAHARARAKCLQSAKILTLIPLQRARRPFPLRETWAWPAKNPRTTPRNDRRGTSRLDREGAEAFAARETQISNFTQRCTLRPVLGAAPDIRLTGSASVIWNNEWDSVSLAEDAGRRELEPRASRKVL